MTPRTTWIAGMLLAAWSLGMGLTAAAEASKPLGLKDGDRVVLLGGGFIERLGQRGYFETLLVSAYPETDFTVRNLGWSGDVVSSEARSRFGGAAEGRAHLLKSLAAAQPTVILLYYGANEANAGPAGLPAFRRGYGELLDALGPTKARLVLLSPLQRETVGPPLPDPHEYNLHAGQYRDAIAELAAERQLAFVDLTSVLPVGRSEVGIRGPRDQATTDSIHLSPYGAWRIAPALAQKLGAPLPRWEVVLGADGKLRRASGTKVEPQNAREALLVFRAADARLPRPPAPIDAPEGWTATVSRRLSVQGLEAGEYQLRIDGRPVVTATAEGWAQGVPLAVGPPQDRAEGLRRAINKKNELYFHRWRPQNETYLYLFRKHEQGNNAVEIPKFDPLVAEQDAVISKLKQPRTHEYTLMRVE